MDRSAFQPNCPGELEPIQATQPLFHDGQWHAEQVDTWAYLPYRLPANLDARDVIVDLYPQFTAAERSLSQLEGVASRLANPHLLIHAFSRREALASSAIENTYATPQELAMFRFDPGQLPDRDQINEVNNYIRVLEHGLASDLPICRRLILELHEVLFEGVSRSGVTPGQFRQAQNFIGKSPRIAEARFVPPPAHHIEQAISDLERFANATDVDLPRLLRLGMIHYQFEAIHPFGDGNGRIGRILIVLMLCKQAQLSKPLVYVSGFFEKHRQQYYDLLYAVSTRSAWADWLSFFLQAIQTQADDAIRRADRLLALQSAYQNKVREKRASVYLPQLVDYLFENPAVTYRAVERLLDCATQTAINLVNRLVEKGILIELHETAHPKVFYAPEIVNVIHSE